MADEAAWREALPAVTDALVATYTECGRSHHLGHSPLPSREAVVDILHDLFDLLYPGYRRRQNLHAGNVRFYAGALVDSLAEKLRVQVQRAIRHELCEQQSDADCAAAARDKTLALMQRLPDIRKTLETDVAAALRGDPAARSTHEIIFCYPGVEAVSIHRVAHELYKLNVPIIPRLFSEYAHSQTGIDIHPGAVIGPSFFIDHGTGVVLGETCVIGQRVKLYQGVTLGALSFRHDAQGNIIKGTRRHPTLEDDVVVYANATILGGTTVIGAGSVVGSNVWLTHGIPPGTTVVLEKPSLRFRGSRSDDDAALMYHI